MRIKNIWVLLSIADAVVGAYCFHKGQWMQAQYFILSAILMYLWREE